MRGVMKVPLLDLSAQLRTLDTELKEAVLAVIDSNQYIMGPQVEQLEQKIAAYCDTSFAVGVSSGTDALLLCLMALNVGPSDLVITSPYSFFATAGVVARLNARPVLVDIDPKTYNLDPQLISDWFKENTASISKVKAIMPVHLYGQCAEMDDIMSVAAEYNIPVIEDAAQAIGSRYRSATGIKKAGSMGLFGCFSFFPSKNLGGIGDGGLVTTNDASLVDTLRKLRTHGAHHRYYHDIVGANFRLDTIQAAALLVKLPHLESWHQRRQENAAYYNKQFAGSPVQTPYAKEQAYHIYNQYIISVPDRRDELWETLSQAGIGCAIYYPVPFHEQRCFASLGYKTGDFPNSEYAAKHTLAIPVYPELTREMQDYVVKNVVQFFGAA